MKRYRSKIGIIWIIAMSVIVYGNYVLIIPLIKDFSWLGFWLNVIILGIVDGLMIACTIGTYYEFHEDYLEVKCGFFFFFYIPYLDIRFF